MESQYEALALICGTEHLSYALLDARANRLAHYLVRRGIGAGDRVGILLERSVQTYVTLLAVLKCGAAFVPLDPSFPQDRITYIAENAALNLLVTTAKFGDATTGTGCGVLELDTAGSAIASEPARRVTTPDSDDALCYIIYTSGSTGRPKGVAVNHSHICNFIAVCTPIYGVTNRDRVYQGMTIAFDFAIEEIWPPFAAGATIVVGPTDHRRLGSGLTDFLIEQEVTLMCCVPTLLATVDRDVPSLHTLLVGGEACPQDLVKRWSHPGRRMLNTYGPTETTVTALWTELVPDKAVTIGKPLPTYTTYILDDALHPMPTGEAGEICIGGLGVTCGYVNLPELTDAKAIEFLRIVLPPTMMYMLIIPETEVMVQLGAGLSAPLLVAVLPMVYLASTLLLTVIVAGLKWLMIGRYRPRVEPMWSNFVWRTELITGLYETVVVPGLLMWFTGTPLMSPVLRLFGARIGRRVYIETTFITEFDWYA